MSTSPDSLARALDSAIGEGPPLPPVETHVTAGRRVVRRRRVVSGLTAAAVVAVLGTTYAVSAGGSDSALDPVPVAPATTTSVPTPAPTTPTGGPAVAERRRGPVGYEGGVLRVRLDVEVVRRVEDPLGAPPRPSSVGVVLRYGDGRLHYWLLDSRRDGGTRGVTQVARDVRGSFDDWLTEVAADPVAPR